MCLMVYVGTRSVPPTIAPAVLGFNAVKKAAEPVRQWFSSSNIAQVGVPAGNCSCAFRHVLAEEPIDWYRGMWDERSNEELATDQAIVEALRSAVLLDGQLELYAVWAGNETKEPALHVDRDLSWLDIEQFFVQENLFYRVSDSTK